ncbi:MAG: hypothetical protein ONB44_21030 [candidate division KSB1 bacterium]|nr:hypothetical protein [candidate division KSB1 bacterium]MDZ7304618.1 hypothetical protein [candidate division KSB1 bacterium]MDZ7313751.1 hypothetical protein [candidate division KSB1 bacterium]
MAKLDEVVAEARAVALAESLHLVELDRTDYAIKMRLSIDHEIFIQIYANETSDKLNLALIVQGKRIYGFDREGGFYHLYPFLDIHQRIPADSPKSITAFAKESLALLTETGLL